MENWVVRSARMRVTVGTPLRWPSMANRVSNPTATLHCSSTHLRILVRKAVIGKLIAGKVLNPSPNQKGKQNEQDLN